MIFLIKRIADNNLTGKSSAEYYYETMNTKYAGNPYTLDAKSTLAVEFINLAQDKVNQYLGCRVTNLPNKNRSIMNPAYD